MLPVDGDDVEGVVLAATARGGRRPGLDHQCRVPGYLVSSGALADMADMQMT